MGGRTPAFAPITSLQLQFHFGTKTVFFLLNSDSYLLIRFTILLEYSESNNCAIFMGGAALQRCGNCGFLKRALARKVL
jgi:hypothetical protein